MSYKMLFALAAGLPLALSGCQGDRLTAVTQPGSITVSGPVRVLDRLNVVNIEMTDQIWNLNGQEVIRVSAACSETVPSCPVTNRIFDSEQRKADFEFSELDESDVGARYIIERVMNTGTVEPWAAETAQPEPRLIDYYRNQTVQTTVGASGELVSAFSYYTGIFVLSIPTDPWVSQSWAVALGTDRMELSRNTLNFTYDGVMLGTDLKTSNKLIGDSRILYQQTGGGLGDSHVDVRISNVRESTTAGHSSLGEYTGPEEFSWNDLPFDDYGSFGSNSDAEGYIEGNFYGRDGGETAGVFERGNVVGAWLAITTSERQARYTELANRQ